MRTYVPNRFEYRVATDLVQVIGRLIHALFLKCHTRGIYFQNWRSGSIVRVIDRAGGVAVEVAAVAGKGDQVSHRMSPQF